MDAMMRCRECHTLFLFADREDLAGKELWFCPGCGAYEDLFDECPEHFEIAWFWEFIQATFSTKERVMLKTVADVGMNFPS